MTEQEIVERFLAEMQSFSLALRQRFERVTDSSSSTAERGAAARELRGLADALGTLCSSFQVTDCAELGAALVGAFQGGSGAEPSSAVTLATAPALDYI